MQHLTMDGCWIIESLLFKILNLPVCEQRCACMEIDNICREGNCFKNIFVTLYGWDLQLMERIHSLFMGQG